MADGSTRRDRRQILLLVLEWALLLMSGWILLSGAFWADIGGRTVSILTVVQLGAPLWILLLPLFGLVAMVLLVRGYQILLTSLAWVYFFGCIYNFNWYDAHPPIEASVPATIAFLSFFLFDLLALALTVLKPIPASRLMQRISLLGRRGLIRGMMSLADELGWQQAGPEGPFHEVSVWGEWKGRPAYIGCTRLVGLPDAITLRVYVKAKDRPWGLYAGYGSRGPNSGQKAEAVYTNCPGDSRRWLDIYVWPPPDTSIATDALDGLASAIEAGRHLFGMSTRLAAGEDAVFFERNSEYRTTLTRRDLEETLGWLLSVAETIERDGLTSPTEQAQTGEQSRTPSPSARQ
jgi:hypothetical protein